MRASWRAHIPCHVYFLLCKEANLVKIGVAENVERRVKDLQRGCPVDLELIGSIDGGYEMERNLHTFFFLTHARDEWFQYQPRVAQAIAALIAGTFDMAILPKVGRRSWALVRRAENTEQAA